MVFSLFARKDKLDSRKNPPAGPRGAPASSTPAAQREAARRTKEKIDRIESEMIAAEAVARAGQSALPTKPAGADGAIETKAAAPVEGGTSLVLGDAAGAMAIDVTGPALPPILEEAAILYSNGQPHPAALVLRQALDDPELAGFRPLAWLMLLDLHQCVGDRSGFDALALQYAAQFESSPPGWSDALSAAQVSAHAAVNPAPRAATAASARSLSLSGALDASIAERASRFGEHADGDAALDCSQATSLDAQGAQVLLALLARFERAGIGLSILGAERMLALARAAIEPGRRDPSEACWMLALQVLRLLGRQQEFDDLGIEYCVTYEVSPPSWEPPAAAFRVLGPQEPAAEPASASGAAAASAPATAPSAARAPSATGAFVLQGDVLGRMQEELQALRSFAAGRGDVVVDCRALRRMEFVAAGDLLNEVATMRSGGRQVLFVEPNYLVYALMLVMGIHDLAEIRRRRV